MSGPKTRFIPYTTILSVPANPFQQGDLVNRDIFTFVKMSIMKLGLKLPLFRSVSFFRERTIIRNTLMAGSIRFYLFCHFLLSYHLSKKVGNSGQRNGVFCFFRYFLFCWYIFEEICGVDMLVRLSPRL